jgi:hypothetical protein
VEADVRLVGRWHASYKEKSLTDDYIRRDELVLSRYLSEKGDGWDEISSSLRCRIRSAHHLAARDFPLMIARRDFIAATN